MNVMFYYELEDSLVKWWQVGLKTCGVNNFVCYPKPISVQNSLDFTSDLLIIENPSETDLNILTEIKSKKTICIVGNVFQSFYKNYPFIDLWIEPCFYDKETEKLFNDNNLPFYYCPRATQDFFIPFYTELEKKFDLSIDDPLKDSEIKIVTIEKNNPHPEIIYGNTKVNLNYQTPKKDFIYLNQKSFDIPMSGNFELSTIPQVLDIFDGKVGYTNELEMMDKIKYYIQHEEERTRMSIKAYEICIAKHTYTYRMRDLLKKIQIS